MNTPPDLIGTPALTRNQCRANHELIVQLVNQYKQGRNVRFEAAWKEHPEWKTQIGIATEQDRKNLGAYIRKWVLGNPSPSTIYRNRKKAEKQLESPAPAKPVGQPQSLVQFCPNCGCNIRAVSAVLNMKF